jgi:hypothetical protein
LQGLQIALRIVGQALLPTGKENPDPFKGHRTHSGMMTFAALALGLVTALGPSAVTDRALSEFMEALAQELWASVSEVDAGFFAGLLPAGSAHRGDAAQGGKFDWAVKALPIGAKGG